MRAKAVSIESEVLLPDRQSRGLLWVWPFWRVAGVLFLISTAALGVYLLVSSRLNGLGFPLDDAWIHQTYARNLAAWGQWSYLPDQPSAGSTAPLWSAVLAVGYGLRLSPFFWTYCLGGLALFFLALSGEFLFRRLTPSYTGRWPWAGIFLAGEWHLVWAAGSGMETVLYAALILLSFLLMFRARRLSWIWVGLIIGMSVWVRPDAVTLAGPAVLLLLFREKNGSDRAKFFASLLAGFLIFFGTYLAFNFEVQGSIWPNTFYAKQAEYAPLLAQPLYLRYLNELYLPLIGSGLFLLPGFAAGLWDALRQRRLPVLAAAAWFLGFALIYAWRLPVTYQYGRYLIPAMPVYFLMGLSGSVLLSKKMAGRWGWALKRVWILSTAIVWLAFYGVVAAFFARDVAIINTEMVSTARWVAENTPPGAIIAAHDIGAMGYFSQRRLVDLAGLISPDVIPFMQDESALAGWLDSQGADYLVTFPHWYTHLTDGKTSVFQSGGLYAPEAGGENMEVFAWK